MRVVWVTAFTHTHTHAHLRLSLQLPQRDINVILIPTLSVFRLKVQSVTHSTGQVAYDAILYKISNTENRQCTKIIFLFVNLTDRFRQCLNLFIIIIKAFNLDKMFSFGWNSMQDCPLFFAYNGEIKLNRNASVYLSTFESHTHTHTYKHKHPHTQHTHTHHTHTRRFWRKRPRAWVGAVFFFCHYAHCSISKNERLK